MSITEILHASFNLLHSLYYRCNNVQVMFSNICINICYEIMVEYEALNSYLSIRANEYLRYGESI
jgi:hypothetical protein